MSLEVIGAGFGRTGTESLKSALETLGFGPCDHMFELIKTTWRVEHLEDLHAGRPADLEALFGQFRSAVDFPYAMYYRPLMAAYPNAKVVLTVRDPERWYESARKTILRGVPAFAVPVSRLLGLVSRNARGFPRWHAYVTSAIYDDFFEGRRHDRAYMIARFQRWIEEVEANVPPDRLLVYEVKDGWEPLCEFLGRPIPAEPFPKSNDSDSFQQRTKLRNITRTILR